MSAAADVSPTTTESTVVSPHQSKNGFWVCLFRLGFVISPAFGIASSSSSSSSSSSTSGAKCM